MVFTHAIEGVDYFLDPGGEDVCNLLLGGELGEVAELLLNRSFKFREAAILQHEEVLELVPIDD